MISEQITTVDGLKLQRFHWPVSEAKGAILLIHGFGEHLGRYQHVVSALNAAGYAVVGQDHRGHGRSEGERAFVTDIDTLVADLKPLWDSLLAEYSGLPAFVMGHSLGGQVAVRFTLRYQDKIRGLVTSGAALSAKYAIPAFAIPIVRWLAKRFPKAGLVPPIGSDALTHDSAVNSAYDADPSVYHGRLKLGMAVALLNGEQDALERAATLRLPMLILHGGQDKVVKPIASQLLHDQTGSPDKTLKIYPTLYHEILNEPEGAEILREIVRWLDTKR